MEELVNIFSNRFNSDYATDCAKLTKKISMDFALYVLNYSCGVGVTIFNMDDLFDKFLEDYSL